MIAFRNKFTTLRTMAPKNAGTNPSILNPGTKAEASFNIKAFITNQKMPREISVSGNVTTFRNKPTVAFTNPITIAAIRAAPKPLTLKASDQVSDNHQADGTQQPVQQRVHHTHSPIQLFG